MSPIPARSRRQARRRTCAPSMCSATYRPWSTVTIGLSRRWTTSVGTADRWKDVPYVELEEHAHDGRSRRRACGEAKEASPGLDCSGIAGEARVDRSDDVAATPRLLDHRDEAFLHFRRCSDLVSRRRRDACGRVHQDECARTLRIRGGEELRHRRGLAGAGDHGTLEADGVHDRGHVVHPVLERRELPGRDRIGQADPVLVERDQPAERGEAAQIVRIARQIPPCLDMAEPRGDEHDVLRVALADDLVRDVRIALLRVLRLWHHSQDDRRRRSARVKSVYTDARRRRLPRISRAALRPGVPITPPPGWAAAPQR